MAPMYLRSWSCRWGSSVIYDMTFKVSERRSDLSYYRFTDLQMERSNIESDGVNIAPKKVNMILVGRLQSGFVCRGRVQAKGVESDPCLDSYDSGEFLSSVLREIVVNVTTDDNSDGYASYCSRKKTPSLRLPSTPPGNDLNIAVESWFFRRD
ncbi:hypothetical protein Tco_1143375 [Tanacetum coccineum]